MTDWYFYKSIGFADFPRVAKRFDFGSPRLGVVAFPDAFVQDYCHLD